MKKLLLIALLSSGAYSQTNFHFYYGLNESLGAELLINGKYGFGFSGTTEKSKALGQFSTGSINDYDRKNFVSTTTQKWFSLYATVGAVYVKDLQISLDLGGALYGRHANFLDLNRNQYYHKKDKVNIKGMIGVNATYPITKDIGWQVGVDTFSGVNTGFVVYF
jgi:hypothetical protein